MTLSPLTLALSPSDGEREWLRRLRQGLVCPSDEGRRCQPALCQSSGSLSEGLGRQATTLWKSSFPPLREARRQPRELCASFFSRSQVPRKRLAALGDSCICPSQEPRRWLKALCEIFFSPLDGEKVAAGRMRGVQPGSCNGFFGNA